VTQPAPSETRMLIDGKLVEARSGLAFDNVNPFTEQTLGQVADGDKSDMDAAVGAARTAFDDSRWAGDRQFRKACLMQLQAGFEAEREALRAELVAEAGAPIALTYGPQLDTPLSEAIPWVVNNVDAFSWDRDLPHSTAFGKRSWRWVYKEPVGVVAAIVPWNYPFEVSIAKVSQALITGNTVVLKPASDTPFNATRLGRIVAEHTDIPPGVLNVVTSSDNEVSSTLVTDHRVDLISFTGSTTVGRFIQRTVGPSMKRVFLELGGKSAHIVLDDADFAATVPAAAGTICMHGGQGCGILSRLLVPRSRYDEAIELATAGLKGIKFGDPNDPEVFQGPQINGRQRDRILGHIENGVAEGARLVLGGGRPAHLPHGYFVEPTLFADVDNAMSIAQEEIFGPVLVVIAFDDDDDAVRIANDTIYGLASAVTSASDDRAFAVARRLKAGAAAINGGVWYGVESPFGGYKSSGVGRQNGMEGFAQYTETKILAGPLR
jgi:aldehyde dehydrogenase (NAD+)